MTSAVKVSSAVSSRYAAALMDLAETSKVLDKVEADLADLKAMVAGSSDLSLLIGSPLVSRVQQESALSALADKAKFQTLTKNFLGVLTQNRRLYALGAIIEAFRAALSRRRGEVSVSVETAQALKAAQVKSLQSAISKGIGSDVTLDEKVNPDILGGMIVTVGSHMIDDSVARKLDRLKAAMNKPSDDSVAA